MKNTALDAADVRLLNLLQADASASTADLAERLGISQSVCWRRIQRLKDDGVIARQVALLDREKAGFPTQILVLIKLNAHGRANLAEFSDAIKRFPEVVECYLLLGHTDFFLKIVMESIEAYEAFFFQKLSLLDGVQEVVSSVALSEIKHTTALPLTAQRR